MVAHLLRSLLWRCEWDVGAASGYVEICAGGGAIIGVENCDGQRRGRECCLSHGDILRLLNIEPEGRGVVESLPGDGELVEPRGRCHVAEGHATEVREIMEDVTGEKVACGGNEVEGPMWLIDLSMRLTMGEMVVLVDPGERWEATVGMLSDRNVQAFVIAPRGHASEAGVSVVSWPARDPGVSAAINWIG
jgi:hypothetical protein